MEEKIKIFLELCRMYQYKKSSISRFRVVLNNCAELCKGDYSVKNMLSAAERLSRCGKREDEPRIVAKFLAWYYNGVEPKKETICLRQDMYVQETAKGSASTTKI